MIRVIAFMAFAALVTFLISFGIIYISFGLLETPNVLGTSVFFGLLISAVVVDEIDYNSCEVFSILKKIFG